MDQSVRERHASVLDRWIFFGLLALIALTTVPYGTVHAWWLALFECLIFALTALWIVGNQISQARRISGHPLHRPLVALLIFALLQTLPLQKVREGVWQTVSGDPYETWRFCFYLLALVLTGTLLLHYTSTPRRLRLLVSVVVGIGLASATFGMARQVAQGDAYLPFLSRLWPGRGYGQFINQNHFAFLLEMPLGLVLGLLAGRGIKRDRALIVLATAITMGAALVLSNSRGAIFAMLCQLLFLALMVGITRARRESSEHPRSVYFRLQRLSSSLVGRIVLITCLLIAVVFSIAWLGGDQLAHRMETVERDFSQGSSLRTNVTRWDMWSATWQSIKANPLVGVGFGSYPSAITKYHDGSGDLRPRQAHNDYLDLLACGGIVGFVLVVWFVIVFIKQVRGRLRSTDAFRRAACLGALVGLFGVAAHSLVDFGLHNTANAVVFTSLVLIATLDSSVEERSLSGGDASP